MVKESSRRAVILLININHVATEQASRANFTEVDTVLIDEIAMAYAPRVCAMLGLISSRLEIVMRVSVRDEGASSKHVCFEADAVV